MMASEIFLQNNILESSLYQLIRNASVPAKLVLLVLLVFSVASWAIIYIKYQSLKRARQHSDAFLRHFRRCSHLSEVYTVADQFKQSPLVGVFLSGYQQLSDLSDNGGEQEQVVTLTTMAPIERALRLATLAEAERLEQGLSWLASIGTASPFIGLLGTVVGIIIAFQGLSVQTETSIQAVAPGIAEALIATALGLFAAIPAYIAYNQFLNQVRSLTGAMDQFALEFLNVIERNVTQYGLYRS
jgi:biopolymer transport protein TolQ